MNNAAAPVNCLLVDDRDENLLALAALLASPGVRTLQAHSAREALELLLTHDVALALVDVQMPEMDGFELAELMRGSERTRQVPIIFVTAGDHDRHRVFRGYDSGAVDFLHKPIEPRVLHNKAQVFFDLYRARQRLSAQLAERTEVLRFNEMFTGILGHDLRGPLSAMMMSAMVLQKRAESEPSRQAAGRMISSGRRMSRLIDDMLDLTRARLGGGIPIERLACALAPVIERAVEEQRSAAPDRTIEWSTIGDSKGDWDEDRLAQVAGNLIGNAVRHGDAAAAIEVDLDCSDDDEVLLTVGNGGTIEANLLEVLFDPFRRGNGLGRSRDGLGIGLYIVSQIVAAHGGKVDARSTGGHTEFAVRLPRRTKR